MRPSLFGAALGVGISCLAIAATANDALVVYIECSGPEGATSQGSGVLVSDQGHVLTARHVVPKGSSCQASIGNNTLQKRGIRPSFQSRQIDSDFDAMLMEFGRNAEETFPYASVCAVTDALKGKEIVAKGFDRESYGAPDFNEGVLSNVTIDFNGMVQMTAETVSGKSGGPVFLKDANSIVGIIAGAAFTPEGIVSSYKMLAVDAVLKSIDTLERSQSCGVERITPKPEPVVQPESPLTEPVQTNEYSGSNIATYIEYFYGHFKQTGPKLWVHHDIDHNTLGTFVETARDNTSITLDGADNPQTVYLDGWSGLITWSVDGAQIDLREISDIK